MKDFGKIAIIIVNWNGLKYLDNCFSSLSKQSYKNVETIMVDNGSSDGSIDFVKKKFPFVKIISLDKNYGYARPNNVGIQEAFKDKKVKAIVALNNDTIVDKHWLEELVTTAFTNDDVGMVSSLAYFEGRKELQNCGLSLEPSLKNTLEGGISLAFGRKPADVPQFLTEYEVFAAGGVAALYKREMLEEIGLFDESYFAYNEDLDLGFRARLYGWRALVSPKATLTHLHSRTGGAASAKKIYWMERNAYYTAIKNMPLTSLFAFPFRNLSLKLTLLRSKNPSVEKAKKNISKTGLILLFLKVHLVVLSRLPALLRARLKIQRERKVSKASVKGWFLRFNRDTLENGYRK